MKARGKEYERLLFTLDAVSDLSQHVVDGRDFPEAARSILYLVLGSVGIPRGALLHCDTSGRLHAVAVKGGGAILFRDAEQDSPLSGNARADLAALAQVEGLIGARDRRLPAALRTLLSNTSMALALPLVVRRRLVGFLALGPRLNGAALTPHECSALETLGRYAAVLLHQHDLMENLRAAVDENVRLCETLANTYFDTVQAFSAAIDAKDVYTRGHSVRVARYSASLALRLGLPRQTVAGIRIGAYLHDIGKIVLDRSLLNKPGRLDEVELKEVACHPVVGYEVLASVSFPWPEVRTVVRSHHERLNGRGYPDGLRGEEIPLPARLLAIADAFDAMTSNRPYRNRMPLPLAFGELVRCSGEQFDPPLVRTFLEQCRSEIEPGDKGRKAEAEGGVAKKSRLRVFGALLDRAGARITTALLDGLLEKLQSAELQPA